MSAWKNALAWWRKITSAPVELPFEVRPPQAVAEVAKSFAFYHPRATVRDWLAFSAHHAENSWLAGFRAGWESAKAEAAPAAEDPLPPVPLDVDLDAVVVMQEPPGYEAPAFVNDMGSKVQHGR